MSELAGVATRPSHHPQERRVAGGERKVDKRLRIFSQRLYPGVRYHTDDLYQRATGAYAHLSPQRSARWPPLMSGGFTDYCDVAVEFDVALVKSSSVPDGDS